MKRIFLLALIVGCSLLSGAARIRVEVLVLGTDPLSTLVQKELERRFEAIPDVISVAKEPDYLVTVLASRWHSAVGDIVAIAADAVEIPERALAAAMLDPKTSPDDVHNTAVMLVSLGRYAAFDQQIGPEEDLKRLCANIVANIDQLALGKERAFPRGGDRDAVFRNFMGRIGAKRVITK